MSMNFIFLIVKCQQIKNERCIKMRVGILCDDDIHGKMKIISAYKRKSLNTITVDFYKEVISDWEKEHGEIKFPE